MMRVLLLFTAGALFLMSCSNADTTHRQEEQNPAAAGFNAAASDAQAIAIADSVMKAMGGRAAWDNTNVIRWNFFGQRTHTWNKQTGRDRIVTPDSSMIIDFNINSREGTVIADGDTLSQADSVRKYIENGYKMWANDSYWLIMPFKLKDSGVTLAYNGSDTLSTGQPAYKLTLTFDSVGVTPNNKYNVFVDTTDYMVREWAYYPDSGMSSPRFVLPWKDYKQYGKIKLSGNRGQNKITDIAVMERWPEK